MKKFLKPLMILGVMACLAGCTAKAAPLEFEVDYTAACGKAKSIIKYIQEFSANPEAVFDEKEFTVVYQYGEKQGYVDGDTVVDYSEQMITKLNLNQNAVSYKTIEHEFNLMDEANEYTNVAETITYLEPAKGMVMIDSDEIATTWDIVETTSEIAVAAGALDITPIEYVQHGLSLVVLQRGFMPGLMLLSEMANGISERDLFEEIVMFEGDESPITYVIGEDTLKITCSQTIEDYVDDDADRTMTGVMNTTLEFEVVNNIPKKITTEVTFKGNIHDKVDDEFYENVYSVEGGSLTFTPKADIEIPDLDTIPYIPVL